MPTHTHTYNYNADGKGNANRVAPMPTDPSSRLHVRDPIANKMLEHVGTWCTRPQKGIMGFRRPQMCRITANGASVKPTQALRKFTCIVCARATETATNTNTTPLRECPCHEKVVGHLKQLSMLRPRPCLCPTLPSTR